MEENEGLKETLRCLRQDNQELRAKLFSKPNNDKVTDIEKRVEHLEYILTPEEPVEENLEVGKWYDARTFKVETLKKLLPVGTLVAIVTDSIVDEKRNKPEGDRSIIVHSTVTSVESEVDERDSEETVIYVEIYQFVSNNWFKIIEEY